MRPESRDRWMLAAHVGAAAASFCAVTAGGMWLSSRIGILEPVKLLWFVAALLVMKRFLVRAEFRRHMLRQRRNAHLN